MFEIKGSDIQEKIIDPAKYGFRKVEKAKVVGGGISENVKIIRDILNGKQGTRQDIVVFNSAFALYVAGKVKKIVDGITLAIRVINEGKAKNVLSNLILETQKYA